MATKYVTEDALVKLIELIQEADAGKADLQDFNELVQTVEGLSEAIKDAGVTGAITGITVNGEAVTVTDGVADITIDANTTSDSFIKAYTATVGDNGEILPGAVSDKAVSIVLDANAEIGTYAFVEGEMNSAPGEAAHAEGMGNIASGIAAHAEGMGTVASGTAAHAEGVRTTAAGFASMAAGHGTIANGENQAVFGAYNVADTDSALIIGNGTSNDDRSNLFAVKVNGDVVLGGNATINGIELSSVSDLVEQLTPEIMDEASFKEAVETMAGEAVAEAVEDAVAEAVSDLGAVTFEVIADSESLPAEGTAGVIYLVSNGKETGNNVYTEYIYVTRTVNGETVGSYETIGTTEVNMDGYVKEEDLGDYVLKSEMENTLADYMSKEEFEAIDASDVENLWGSN